MKKWLTPRNTRHIMRTTLQTRSQYYLWPRPLDILNLVPNFARLNYTKYPMYDYIHLSLIPNPYKLHRSNIDGLSGI